MLALKLSWKYIKVVFRLIIYWVFFFTFYRGHKSTLTELEAEQASRYTELSTLKIGESLNDPQQHQSSQGNISKKSSRHRRHSGSVPESVALGQYGETASTEAGAYGLEGASAENSGGHRRRSLSDSRTRSSGKYSSTLKNNFTNLFRYETFLKIALLLYLSLHFFCENWKYIHKQFVNQGGR